MQPGGKERLRELALFAGAGGGILGGHLLGWRCVCAVELEDYPRRVLLARQRDGMLPRFPIWDDVTTFDGLQWRGRVDVISGGFPCQDISAAGRGAGITGARSGLWTHMARIIGEVRPRYCFVENSPLLVSRGLNVVLDSLAALGYDARWGIVGAHHAGAPHKRDRIWIRAWRADCHDESKIIKICGGKSANPGRVCAHVADAHGCLCDGRTDQPERGPQGRTAAVGCGEAMADTQGRGFAVCRGASGEGRHAIRDGVQAEGNEELSDSTASECNGRRHGSGWGCGCQSDDDGGGSEGSLWWLAEPDVGGVVDGLAPGLDIHGAAAAGDVGRVAMGVPNRVGRLKAIGNGQVPAVAALAWRVLASARELGIKVPDVPAESGL